MKIVAKIPNFEKFGLCAVRRNCVKMYTDFVRYREVSARSDDVYKEVLLYFCEEKDIVLRNCIQ